ncbi:MAG TPA: tRNA-dihydrouridine synthase family protein [Spirochaetota bacterium]|nr:tRNA-dihydrouridine synthase family protein [Spirochaetota bacterium]HOM38367.1 tRNA-dihydrouridine synthase family protein [Spirochaetota bacterium]HPQ48415.1 tRNA-dihydrouridine synthase family protein [Spirochaetota bacterium]
MNCLKKEKKLQNLYNNLKNILILTAPIAGYTRYSFRKLVKDYFPDIIYTEMLSVKSVIYDNKTFYQIIQKNRDDINIGIQLFGSEPEDFVKAIKIIKEKDKSYNIFDINMGCPVKKVIKTGAGSALLKNPEKVYKIVKSIRDIFPDITLSAKIRLGFDNNSRNYLEISSAIEEAKANFITVHGRTRTQLYSGEVDYNAIAEIKEKLNIPVIANGNIFTPEIAKKVIENTKCDGIMLARGIIGNPFLIHQIREFLEKGYYTKPTINQIIEKLIQHFELEKDEWHEFKKIGICYLKGLPNSTDFKRLIAVSRTREELEQTIKKIKEYYTK